MPQPSSPRGLSAQGLVCLTFSQEIHPDGTNKSTRRTYRNGDKWERTNVLSLLCSFSYKLQRNPLSNTPRHDVEEYTPHSTHTHTHVCKALLVPVIMTLVDPLTQVMYFCAVCQLPKCVFWLQSGSCIVGNVDEK